MPRVWGLCSTLSKSKKKIYCEGKFQLKTFKINIFLLRRVVIQGVNTMLFISFSFYDARETIFPPCLAVSRCGFEEHSH